MIGKQLQFCFDIIQSDIHISYCNFHIYFWFSHFNIYGIELPGWLETSRSSFVMIWGPATVWSLLLTSGRWPGKSLSAVPDLPWASRHLQNLCLICNFSTSRVNQREMLYWKKRDWSDGLRERKKFSVLQKDCLFVSNVSMSDWSWSVYFWQKFEVTIVNLQSYLQVDRY